MRDIGLLRECTLFLSGFSDTNNMKHILGFILLISSFAASMASAQNDLNMNGIASFEQLRKEYYIGALYLGWAGRDAATITNMPGKKRMELRITADRWPSLRFAQMWNQLITINNPSATLNANANDMLAFTSLPKGDLVAGDILAIELTGNNTTLVTLNGTPALRTGSPALFNMLLNSWIGQRPPSSEFKRDILELQKSAAGTELLARYQAVQPNDSRKKVIAGWGFKASAPETETPPATATAPAPAPSATPAPAPAVAATAPKTETPKPEAPKPQPEPKAPPAAAPAKPAATAAAPAPTANDAQQIAEQQARAAEAKAQAKAKQELQARLYDSYLGEVRKLVVRHVEYPKRAQKDNIEGLVMMRVRIDRGGNLASFEIAQSADDLLDEAALKAVKKAAPFPKASDQLEGNIFEFLVPMVFKLAQ